MKKMFFVLFLFVINITVIAQTHTDNLKFMGITINGTCYEFAQKLKQKGLEIREKASPFSTYIILEGNFAGINDCVIYVYGTDVTRTVYSVKVLSPSDDPIITKSLYKSLKESLIEKYGQPKSENDDMYLVNTSWDNGIFITIDNNKRKVKIVYENENYSKLKIDEYNKKRKIDL